MLQSTAEAVSFSLRLTDVLRKSFNEN